MKTMLLALAALFLLAPATSLAGPLDTDVILELLDAGVSDVTIQRYVQRNHFTFDLSAQDLMALKGAGASDSLIGFLQDREEGAPSLAQEEPARPSDSSQDDEEYGEGYYGVSTYAPYYYGYGYGYPYYYSGFYYPYYYPYYGPYYSSYYSYPYYDGGRGGRGSGVVSYWYDSHSGRSSSRPSASGSSTPAPRRSSGHRGGHGRR